MTKSKIVLIAVAAVGITALLGMNGYVLWQLNADESSEIASSAVETPSNGASGKSMIASGPSATGGFANMNATITRDTSKTGPWDNNLVITSASSIADFDTSITTFVEAAGVPTLAKTSDGTLYASFQWFPDIDESFDKVATSISTDDGATWSEPETIVIDGMSDTLQRAFDPTLVVLADDTIRLFFTTSEKGEQETFIASATSTDGVHFTFEGTAFAKSNTRLYDCAVVPVGDGWLISTPNNPDAGTYHATSTDGVTFTYTGVNSSNADSNWTGNYLVDNEEIYFFGTDSEIGMWYATSADGETWSTETALGVRGGDPAVVKADNGTYFLVYTSAGMKK